MKLKLLALAAIFLLSSYLIYNFVGEKDKSGGNIIEKFTKDEISFKKEYEALNGKKNEETGNAYLNINILEDNNVDYLKIEEVIDFLKTGTGILYFGFPECPWCRNAVPVLLSTAESFGIEKISYFNPYTIRDTKHLENGVVVTDKEGSKEYYEILSLLGVHADVYEGLNDESIKRLYLPTVVFVKDGVVLSTHTSTVDSQENPSVVLTDTQKDELTTIYTDGINSVYEILCNEECK